MIKLILVCALIFVITVFLMAWIEAIDIANRFFKEHEHDEKSKCFFNLLFAVVVICNDGKR